MYFRHYTLLRKLIAERNESKLSETKWRYMSYNEWTWYLLSQHSQKETTKETQTVWWLKVNTWSHTKPNRHSARHSSHTRSARASTTYSAALRSTCERRNKEEEKKNNNKSVANLSNSHHHQHHNSPPGRRVKKRQLQNLKFTYTAQPSRTDMTHWNGAG